MVHAPAASPRSHRSIPSPDDGRSSVPDRAGAGQWLASSSVVAAGGVVSAGSQPARLTTPCHATAALWLSWVAWRSARDEALPPRKRIAEACEWLAGHVDGAGAIGHDGRLTVADTCLAAHALIRALDFRFVGPDCGRRLVGAFRRARDGVARFIASDRPVLPVPTGSALEPWGFHLHRGAAQLLSAGHAIGDARAVAIARALRSRASDPPDASPSAVLPAIEGELLFRALGEPEGALDVRTAAATLASSQRKDGSFDGRTRGDDTFCGSTTARAIRAWLAASPARHPDAIRNAAAALAAHQHADGSVGGAPGADRRDTAATVFTDQAVAWMQGLVEDALWL